MFYKPYSRKEVKLDNNQLDTLRYLVKWLREQHGIKKKAEPLAMFKGQLLDEYEKLSYDIEDKLILEAIETYETKRNFSLPIPSAKTRRRIRSS